MNKEDQLIIMVLKKWAAGTKVRKVVVERANQSLSTAKKFGAFIRLAGADCITLDSTALPVFLNGTKRLPPILLLTDTDRTDGATIERLINSDSKILFIVDRLEKTPTSILDKAVVIRQAPTENN
jgi:hypothetical protein